MPTTCWTAAPPQEVAWLRAHVGEERIVQLTGNRIDDHPVLVNLLGAAPPADDFRRIWR